MAKEITMPRPFDADIESVVLGVLMIEPRTIPDIYPILKPEMFYQPGHELVYQAIISLYEAGKPVDILTVSDELRRQDTLDKAGGPYYITRLTGRVAGSAHLEYHVSILVDLYIRREFIRCSQEQLAQAMDQQADTTDLIGDARRRMDAIEGVYRQDSLRSLPELLEDTLRQAQRRMQTTRNGLTGVPTGLEELNKLTAGFQEGELILLAGRPGMGKTAVSLRMAWEAAKAGFKVVYYSIEMTGERLTDRWIIGQTGIDPDHWRNGQVTKEEEQKVAASVGVFRKMPVHVDDNPLMSMDSIYASASRLRHKGACDLLFVDYLQLSEIKGSKPGNTRAADVGEATRKAKLMAKKLGIPVVLLSQLNRKSEEREDKRPGLADLRESGNIEQDADLVMLVHCPEKAGLKRDDRSGYPVEGLGLLIVAKNRNGRMGDVYFGYNDSMTLIGDYVPPAEWMERNAKPKTAKEIRKRYRVEE